MKRAIIFLLFPLVCSALEISQWAFNTKGWENERGEFSTAYFDVAAAIAEKIEDSCDKKIYSSISNPNWVDKS
jgi:hypothetical protein